ncbi:MAG TPA: hypothetical protein GX705_00735 [Clostridiales bacterium]|nr:hypothetical protein [Clostridiales bacterium]
MKRLIKYINLGVFGGVAYYGLENIWRGYSHWTMVIVGGLCFLVIGLLNEFYTWDMALLSQMLISTLIITSVELIAGLIVNKWLGLNVWDYSDMPYNFLGQICLVYSNLWFLISLPVILLDDYIRYWVFKEEKPHYKIF